MLPYLSHKTPFPPTHSALSEPNGLLAAGGDLSSERLRQAYSEGIFPWYSIGEPILWWCPDPRAVFFLDKFKVHKSVIKTLKRNPIEITLNTAFDQVIEQCAQPRHTASSFVSEDDEEENGTWITNEMMQAYSRLHQLGYAHSVEVWQQEELVGGIYGVASGGVFCGESMFSRVANGSKIALSCLINYLKNHHFILLDCQIENPHLMKLGATNISRKRYLELLSSSQQHSSQPHLWQCQTLNWQQLLIPTHSPVN